MTDSLRKELGLLKGVTLQKGNPKFGKHCSSNEKTKVLRKRKST